MKIFLTNNSNHLNGHDFQAIKRKLNEFADIVTLRWHNHTYLLSRTNKNPKTILFIPGQGNRRTKPEATFSFEHMIFSLKL